MPKRTPDDQVLSWMCGSAEVNNLHICDVELFDWLVFNACMMWRYFIGLFLIESDVAD